MTTIATSKDAMAQARVRMEKAVEDFRRELAGVRTGRANVSVLDSIRVDYHGTPMPVNQLGTVTVPDPMSIVICAVGSRRGAADRQSDSHGRPGPESDQRRKDRARADSAAHRGPPQGYREAFAQSARKSSHRRAQYPARHEGSDRASGERKEGQRGRAQARASTNWTRSRTARPKKSRTSAAAKRRKSWS